MVFNSPYFPCFACKGVFLYTQGTIEIIPQFSPFVKAFFCRKSVIFVDKPVDCLKFSTKRELSRTESLSLLEAAHKKTVKNKLISFFGCAIIIITK